MPRRFLTADDVRRAQGGSIDVDPETLVTPQARELADELGVAIRSGGAAHQDPAPDRGPDAERARRTLPNLPEPDPETPTGLIVTAVGKNRPGILNELTSALAEHGASVLNVSQAVMQEYFHIILMVEIAPGREFGALKTRLECLGGPEDYAVRVMHERVFRFMHRV